MNQQHKNTVDQSKLRFLTKKQLKNYHRELETWGHRRANLYLKACRTGGLSNRETSNGHQRLTPKQVADIVASSGSVTLEKFKELTGCCHVTAHKHLTMLVRDGVLIRHRKGQKSPFIYSPTKF